jgi:hypothetical protein
MKIIIVGNAASVLTKQNGVVIDSFDKVIRINKFKISPYELYIGSKTNIYCSKWLNMQENITKINSFEEVWLPYPQSPHWWISRGNFSERTREECDLLTKQYKVNIKYLSQRGTEEIDSIFNRSCHPSTGLICLWMAIEQYKESDIYYTGFDGFSTGWYWDPSRDCTVNMKNSILFEKIFLNKMKRDYGIKELE